MWCWFFNLISIKNIQDLWKNLLKQNWYGALENIYKILNNFTNIITIIKGLVLVIKLSDFNFNLIISIKTINIIVKKSLIKVKFTFF